MYLEYIKSAKKNPELDYSVFGLTRFQRILKNSKSDFKKVFFQWFLKIIWLLLTIHNKGLSVLKTIFKIDL